MSEIVKPGMGIVVKSWNNSDLVKEMVAIIKGETDFDPSISRARVKEFFVEIQGARWVEIIKRYFA